MKLTYISFVRIVFIIGVLVCAQGCNPEDSVSVYLPKDIDAYRQKAALSVQDGSVFHLSEFPLVKESITPPKESQYQAVIEATTAPLLNVPQRGAVRYFSLQAGVAYVVLEMDEDAWAGVTTALAGVRPLVTYNLLQFEEINEVRFGYPVRTRKNKIGVAAP